MRAKTAALLMLAFVAAFSAHLERSAESDATKEFNIAAQPVSEALRVYAEQSGDQIVFYSEIGKGRESAPVEGRYTRQEALRKLLENTGLEHHRVNSKTVAISAAKPQNEASVPRTTAAAPLRLAQAAAPEVPAAATPATRDVEAVAPEDSLFGVEEVIVTGTAVAERTKF